MHVRELMTPRPNLVTPQTTVKEAASIMRECECGYLPVGENDRLVGAITDRDIAVRAVAEGKDPETTRVGDIMTTGIKYCFENAPVEEVAELMEKNHVRRLVVLDRNKRMTGIISIGDIATRGDNNALVGEIESEVCLRRAA